jgi:aminoglycoside phosphotransferase (APT) family kinase protein
MSLQDHEDLDTLELSPGKLARCIYEAIEVPAGALSVARIKGGQSNPTYTINFDGRPELVLRKKPAGKLLPSAHAIDREFRVMSALSESGVPVPRMKFYCDDETVIGTAFFVMEHMAGRNFWEPTLPALPKTHRRAIYRETVRVLAALHSIDPAAVGLNDFGRPGNYFARQIDRWTRQYRASETEPIPAMDRLANWLPKRIPQGDESGIVHGDYRFDNLIFHPSEPRVLAVLDWELSTIGHPLADLSYHVMTWRMPQNLRGLSDADLPALGIPEEQEHIESYRHYTPLLRFRRRDWEFAMAYNLFRVAAIRQGVLRRGLDGNAASEHALEAGARAREAARIGWEIAERIENDQTL